MSWVSVDDQFPDHPKIVAAGPAAAWLYVCGLCYAARYLTDGHIPLAQVPRLAALDEPLQLAQRLVEARLWEWVADGYRVHDYLNYQLSADEVRERRAQDRARKADWRTGKGMSPRNPNGLPAESVESPDGIRRESAENPLFPSPSPSPVPNPVRSPSESPSHAPSHALPASPYARARASDAAASRPWDAAETEVAVAVWERASPVVRDRLSAGNWSAFLDGAQPLGVRDGELVLCVRSHALLDQAARFVPLIAESLRGLDGDAPRDVRLVASTP